ncbi:hypothetical protein O181_020326 [Austropuccinia psidii MF-1]|uniref:Uncharacterized protein n=1 Tax=Austropuccinia psidii MF-1 TaxID=1389203 RepID=A0A9Q3GUQ5_9BASI|nr:hypothetical protein [Austropuccinia psidii MF-1]
MDCDNTPIIIKAFTKYLLGDIKPYIKSREEADWLLENRAGWTHQADPLFATSSPPSLLLFVLAQHSLPNSPRRPYLQWKLHENNGLHSRATPMFQLPETGSTGRPTTIDLTWENNISRNLLQLTQVQLNNNLSNHHPMQIEITAPTKKASNDAHRKATTIKLSGGPTILPSL